MPILIQESFRWWQCNDRYIISLSPHLRNPFPSFFPSLISLTVSVDVKHHVYLLWHKTPSYYYYYYWMTTSCWPFSVTSLQVDVTYNRQKVKPGEDVLMTVTARPSSVVFLLGIDKSVKLLKSGNDITREMVSTSLVDPVHCVRFWYWILNKNWFCLTPVHNCVAEFAWNVGYICHWGASFF